MTYKNYFDYMDEISSDELFDGLLGYGLIAEKIPPIFTSEAFSKWSKTQEEKTFTDKQSKKKNVDWEYYGKDYIRYDNMRNINIPRPLAIPNPIAYRNQCKTLSDSWGELKTYFKAKTNNQSHKISRIHIRKLKNKKHLFEMNYKNFLKDDLDIKNGLSIGSRYVVKADISNCFPSIYTHSIPWAVVGKESAKQHKKDTEWFNQIDKFTRNLKFGETHGVLIGPHTSNIISEIVLIAIDYELANKGYKYTRHIDDYSCFVETHEKTEQFLLDLSSELKKYELTLNHKKTEIIELPVASVEHWVNKMNSFCFSQKKDSGGNVYMAHKELKSYLDLAIELLGKTSNTAIINYAIKVIAKKKLREYSQKYYLKRIHHLLLLYPYLVTLIDEFVFEKFDIELDEKKQIANNIFELGLDRQFYEASSYALFFAIKHNFKLEIDGVLADKVIDSDDCIFMMLAYLYDKENKKEIDKYSVRAKEKNENEFDRYWLFVYQVLGADDLKEPYKSMKKKIISFVKDKKELYKSMKQENISFVKDNFND
jgi:hypothetical protein